MISFEAGSLTEYSKAISKELANSFQKKFWSSIDSIKSNPLHFQVHYKNIRLGHLKVFPYSIHFIVEDNIIRVLKILHQKQYYK